MLDKIFNGQNSDGRDKVDRIIELTEKMERIQKAINFIRYDDDLFALIPDAVVTLGAAKDALAAALKTV